MFLGIKQLYRFTLNRGVYGLLFVVIIFEVYKNGFLSSPPEKIIIIEREISNICLYYPNEQHYTLRLQPRKQSFPLEELDSQDYKKLFDIENFNFNINEPSKCANSSILLLVLVTSASQNFNRRNTIRTTWGQQDKNIRLYFMLGMNADSGVQKSIELEHKTYGDIIQGSFLDSYKNLTYKTVMALKYVIYHCPNHNYVLKTDDDVFVNIPLMKNYLTNDLSPFGAQNLLQCLVFVKKIPERTNSKWALTEEEFPESVFPTYCNGAWALFSPDVLFKLYREAQKTKFLYLEDIFLYGLAGRKVKGLVHSDITNLTLSYKSPYDLPKGKFDNINFLIGTFGMDDDQMKKFWNYVKSRPVRSSVYDYSEICIT